MKTIQEIESAIAELQALLELKEFYDLASKNESFGLQITISGVATKVTDPAAIEGFRKAYCASLERQIAEQQIKVDNLYSPIVYPVF